MFVHCKLDLITWLFLINVGIYYVSCWEGAWNDSTNKEQFWEGICILIYWNLSFGLYALML